MRASIARPGSIAAGFLLVAAAVVACRGGFTAAESTPTPADLASPNVPSTGPSGGATTVPPSTNPLSSASTVPSLAGPFTLTSPSFGDRGAIPKDNTCDGRDQSPDLRWSNAPTGTAALVLELLDPDAHDWVHWLVLDVAGAADGSIPANVGTGSGAPQQGRNSFGKVGWGGPCPPSGTHHYVFTLFALDAPLRLSGNPDRAAVDKAVAAHRVLARATLTGTYRRS